MFPHSAIKHIPITIIIVAMSFVLISFSLKNRAPSNTLNIPLDLLIDITYTTRVYFIASTCRKLAAPERNPVIDIFLRLLGEVISVSCMFFLQSKMQRKIHSEIAILKYKSHGITHIACIQSLSIGAVILQMILVSIIKRAPVFAMIFLRGSSRDFLFPDTQRKYVPINIQRTPIIPQVFGSSPLIKKPVNIRKGIVRLESGHTRERSPYLTALREVTVVIAFHTAQMSMREIYEDSK